MSYESIRNKKLVEFPDGKLMFFCEVSSSNVSDAYGKRCWDKVLIHPKESLYHTTESLRKEQSDYVEKQLRQRREFSQYEVEKGYADKAEEPSLESYDFYGTVYPGGSRIKNGKAFYSGKKTIKAEEFFSAWDSPKRIRFSCYDKDFKRIYEETYDILRADLDECYKDALNANDADVYISIF